MSSSLLHLSIVVVLLASPVFCAHRGDLDQPLVNAEQADAPNQAGFGWLTLLGFGFLTFNSGMAIYRSDQNLGAIGFVAFSYFDLIALFLCLRWYESAARDSPVRYKLKIAFWCLTTMLTLAFSHKVAIIMPIGVQCRVWTMALATIFFGFYAVLLHEEQQSCADDATC